MILVIDNYDSFTYNLVHLVAGTGHETVIRRNDEITLDEIAEASPSGILISPGPGRPADAGITEDLIKRFAGQVPILGVCLGHQAIGEVFGARVTYAPVLMHGKTSTVRHDGKGVFEGVEQDFTATRYHSLVVDPATVPDELLATAWTQDDVVMGLRHKEFQVEGIQFHPESLLTTEGPRMIQNWIRSIGRR